MWVHYVLMLYDILICMITPGCMITIVHGHARDDINVGARVVCMFTNCSDDMLSKGVFETIEAMIDVIWDP